MGGPSGARRAKSHRARRSKRLTRRAGTGRCCTECRLPRRTIIQFATTASRAFPAVASHAIGFADPRPGVHSPGIGACRGRREQSRIRPGQCQLHALVVVAKSPVLSETTPAAPTATSRPKRIPPLASVSNVNSTRTPEAPSSWVRRVAVACAARATTCMAVARMTRARHRDLVVQPHRRAAHGRGGHDEEHAGDAGRLNALGEEARGKAPP